MHWAAVISENSVVSALSVNSVVVLSICLCMVVGLYVAAMVFVGLLMPRCILISWSVLFVCVLYCVMAAYV